MTNTVIHRHCCSSACYICWILDQLVIYYISCES